MSIRRVAVETREDWLAARTTGIGASEAPAILGESPWAGPLTIWRRKRGLEPEAEDTIPMEVGRVLEPVIVRRYQERHPDQKVTDPGGALFRSTEFSWLLATPDRLIEDPTLGPGVLEAKHALYGAAWGEEPDASAWLQTQAQMIVLGVGWAALTVLIGGREPRDYIVEQHPTFRAQWPAFSRRFWQHVEAGTPPEPGAADLETVKALYPRVERRMVTLPPAAVGWLSQWELSEVEIKTWERARDEAKALLLASMAAGERAVVGGVELTRQLIKRPGYEVKPTEFVQLRKAKERTR
jgi:putative phage-type endonuclease